LKVLVFDFRMEEMAIKAT